MNVDDLIDRVARELTAAEPTPALAEQVRARIATMPQERSWSSWTGPLAGLAAAAAAVIVAATLLRPANDLPTVAAPVSVVDGTAGAALAVAAAPEPPAAVTSADRPSRRREPIVDSVEAAWRARAIAALAAPTPIVIEGIQPPALSIPLMEVEPLTTPPIEIAPVGSSGGR